MEAATLTALAEPNRRRILDLLRDGERPVGEVAHALEMRSRAPPST